MTSRRPGHFRNLDLHLEVTSPDLFALLAGLGRPDGPANVPLIARLNASVSDDAVLLKDLRFDSDGASLVAAGKVRLGRHLVGSDLQLEFTAPDTTLLAALSTTDLPDDSVATTFHLRSVNNGLRIDDLSVRLGTNRVRGTFALDSGDIPDIRIDLIADALDISRYMAETPTQAAHNSVAPDARLIPEIEIPVQWLGRGNLVFSFRSGKLISRLREFSEIELNGNVHDGELYVRNFHIVDTQGGDLAGHLRMRPHTAGAELRIQLQGKNVELGLTAKTSAEQKLLPRFAVDTIMHAHGKTTREMAGNVRGYVKLVGGAGIMRAGAVKAISSDFVSELVDTINPFLKKDPFLNLQCAVLLATMQDGQISGSPVLAMQSDRLNITAKAKIDLNTEVIDADINTVAQQGLGFSLNDLLNPYIKIKGTLANPSLAFDKGNALVQGGAAVATGGISILAKNLSDRFLSSSEICQKMLDQSQGQFEALARQYANTVADK
jgi:hypothetical protein